MESIANSSAKGYVTALASAVILSTTAVFIRFLTQTYVIAPLVLAVWRAGLASLTLVVILALARPGLLRVSGVQLKHLVLFGLTLAVLNSLWTLSVVANGAAVATVLVYSSAAFSALLGCAFQSERISPLQVSVIALSLLGCALVSGVTSLSGSGYAAIGLGMLSGLAYAVYTLMGKAAAGKGLSPWTSLCYTLGFATIFLLLFNCLPMLPGTAHAPRDFFSLGHAWSAWGVLFALAAGPTVLGFGLYNQSLLYLPSSVVNLVVTSEPVFTMTTAYLILGERMTLTQIMGSIVLLLAVAVLGLWRKRTEGKGKGEAMVT